MAFEDYEYTEQSPEQGQQANIDFSKFFKGIWRRKWLILILSIVSTIPFYFFSKNQIPLYKCKVVFQSKQYGDSDRSFFDAETQAEILSESFSEHMAEVLGVAFVNSDSLYTNFGQVFSEYHTTSAPIVARYKIVIDELGNYFLVQRKKDGRAVVDSANVWDAVDMLREVNGISFRLQPTFVHGAKEFSFRIMEFNKAVRMLQYSVSKDFSRSGKTMVMYMKGEDPQYIARELNRIADHYLIEMQKLKSSDMDKAGELLRKKLAVAEANMRISEQNLRNFYSRYPLSIDVEKKELLGQLKSNERGLEEFPQQRKQLTNLLTRLQTPEGEEPGSQYRNLVIAQIANFPAMAGEPEMTIHRQNLEQLGKRYQELLSLWSPENPQVKSLQQQIFETQEQVIQFATAYRNTLAERESELRRQKVELEKKLQALPNDEYRLMELERTKAINEDLYKLLFAESQKRQVAESGREQSLRILDYASVPTRPMNPSKKSQVMLGSVLGLLLGMLLSIVVDLTDRTLRTSKDVDRYLKLPVIGAIPVVSFKDIPDHRDDQKALQIDKQLVTHDYSPTPVGEAYRALRTTLLFSKDTEQFRSLLITSISPEEGKSFTAANLAIILAQQRTNTLLIDADLRRGVLHNTFSVPKEPGLTNYLSNKSTLNSLVRTTHIPNLSVLSCGSLVPNPSELLGSLQMRRLMAELKRKFDYVILDTPPLDAATDSVVLSTQVDAVAVVVRYGKTNHRIAQERLEVFKSVPAHVIGIIINGTEETVLKSSYSYYHY